MLLLLLLCCGDVMLRHLASVSTGLSRDKLDTQTVQKFRAIGNTSVYRRDVYRFIDCRWADRLYDTLQRRHVYSRRETDTRLTSSTHLLFNKVILQSHKSINFRVNFSTVFSFSDVIIYRTIRRNVHYSYCKIPFQFLLTILHLNVCCCTRF